jgi:hypothetical protein
MTRVLEFVHRCLKLLRSLLSVGPIGRASLEPRIQFSEHSGFKKLER